MGVNFSQWLCESTERKYSYLKININGNLQEKIIDWSYKNIKNNILYNKKRVLDTHITVLFGLLSKKPMQTIKACNGFERFSVKFGKISKFSQVDHDVIKIEVLSDSLKDLNKIIAKLPHETEHDSYIPHCTIAYVEKGSCDNLLGNNDFNDDTFNVSKLVFVGELETEFMLKERKN